MARRTRYADINKGNEFFDKFGTLLEGYSFNPGDGRVAVGVGKVNQRSGGGKDGIRYDIVDKTIWGPAPTPKAKPAPKPAAAPPPTPKIDKVEQTYLKQIKTLQDQIKQIQAAPPKPTLPPPKPPTTPYSVGTTPISLSNPYKRKTMGGIGQFKSKVSQGMATIKSGLVNI